MPRPLLQLLCQMIAAKGGDEYILDQVADNVRIVDIVEEFVNPQTGKPFNKGMLYYWRNMKEERKKAWAEARQVASYNLMDEAADDIAAAETKFLVPAQVSLLKEKIKFKQYLAERYNREEFGEQKQAPVQISFGDSWLGALREHGSSKSLPPAPAEEIPEADYVVEGEDTVRLEADPVSSAPLEHPADDPIAELLA